MSYIKCNVNISKEQEDKLQNAIKSKKAVSLRLSKNDLIGNHMLLLTQGQIKSIQKAKSRNEGVTLQLSARQVKVNLTVEGGFLGMLAALAATALPWLAKTILPGLATGLISGGVEKAISGSGIEKDGFFIQRNGECCEGTFSGKGLYLNPSNYRPQYGDGLYLKSGGNVYEGGSILNKIPIIGPFLKMLGL